MNIAELMTSDALTLEPESSLRDALQDLTAAGVSGAPVVVGGRLVGVISTSDRVMWDASSADLVERMAEPDSPEWDLLAEHVVGEVMTRRIVALPPTADVVEAARLMVRKGVHRLIVAEADALVGIVSALDVVRAVADDRLRPVT